MIEKLGENAALADPAPVDLAIAPVAEDPPPKRRDWPNIRQAYESGEGTIARICEQFAVTKGALEYRARRDRWIGRQARDANARSLLLGRMFKVLDGQVQHLESADMTSNVEKQTVLLGTMAKTLEKLIELDHADRGNKPAQKKDIRDLRNKLAARIDQLKQR